MSRGQRRQTPPLGTRPLINPLEFVGSWFGSRMQESIAGERHSAVSHDGGELSKEVMLLLGVILAPAGQIQMAAGLVHILLDQPRHGGNITIPGPFGSLRVAILTGLFQAAHHGGIDIGAREQWPSRIGLQSERMDEGRRDGKDAGAGNGIVTTL